MLPNDLANFFDGMGRIPSVDHRVAVCADQRDIVQRRLRGAICKQVVVMGYDVLSSDVAINLFELEATHFAPKIAIRFLCLDQSTISASESRLFSECLAFKKCGRVSAGKLPTEDRLQLLNVLW
jgi:hypothetical protein